MRTNFRLLQVILISLSVVACSKGGGSGTTPPSLPSASISSVSGDRNPAGSVFSFTVSLSSAATSDVTIHYTTVAGTALETKDYAAAAGTVSIATGKTSANIDVQVTGDSLRKPNQSFYVQLDAPQNCTLKTSKGFGTIINENGLYFPVDNAGYSTPANYPGYTLAWADEFNSKTIDDNSWTFESGNNNGWGNAELENYTGRTQNAFASNGNLIIEARQENFGGSQYTSARMITKNKKIFKYGRIDIRAKLPSTKGIWPALWLLGNNIDAVSWPACGEIDMMELLGQEPNKVYNTLHWGATFQLHDSKGSNYVLPTGSFDQQFHVYSMEWQENSIKIFIDDQLTYTLTNSDVSGNPYPFNNDFFFIFNIAVGGNWPGAPDANTIFPQRMAVDYIRVFQK